MAIYSEDTKELLKKAGNITLKELSRLQGMSKPRCPEACRKPYHEVDGCALDDRMVCLLESGTECQIYQEFLAKPSKE